MEYFILPKRSVKVLCKSKHFLRRYRRKREWVFFLNTVYNVVVFVSRHSHSHYFL